MAFFQNRRPAVETDWAGTFSLVLRLVVGWTYFSAFWRRLVLHNKLDPDTAAYIGQKFNHFLPQALGIQGLIEFLLTHPTWLWWAMVSFTIIEGIVGLAFMLGLFTRTMSVVVVGLALGILLGAGWLGTTCLDEWQIGVLGIAAGFSVFLSGGGIYSLDSYLPNYNAWFTSGALSISESLLKRITGVGAAAILALTLFTNQYFHGGLWGPLHNMSIRPKLELSAPTYTPEGGFDFTLYRVEGVDVYGAFLIDLQVITEDGGTLLQYDGRVLSAFPKAQIQNEYIVQIRPDAHSLLVPLGGKARIQLRDKALQQLPTGTYTLQLTDISGAQWRLPFTVE